MSDELLPISDMLGLDPASRGAFEEIIKPAIRQMRQAAITERGSSVGAWAVGMNRTTSDCYVFGTDALDREFALTFTPEQFRAFAAQVNAVAQALP